MKPWHQKVFLIAEAGVNHNGDRDRALRLVDAAADAGADAVKFQTFHTEAVVTRRAGMAEYQKQNTGNEETQFAMIKRLELNADDHHALVERAKQRGILLFSTAFDLASVDFLQQLNIPVWKIPSGEITNYPYLVRIAGMGKPIIISTGMAMVAEIDEAINVLLQNGAEREQLCILHCNTEYPTPWQDVNLRAMANLGKLFGADYGYSDHTLGTEIPVAAVALGARVIEKHFTLDRNLPGPDHKASLEPDELASMVRAVRNVELALGDGIKRPSASESKNRPIARKSMVAACVIKKGEVFSEHNLAIKRPGDGISPMQWPHLLGRAATRDYDVEDRIEW